jgi:prevent-host-death family protein
MPRKIGVAEVKKNFSVVLSEVSLNGEHFIIEKKGKPVAAMVSIRELELLEGLRQKKTKGLLAAIGAWEDFDDLEETIAAIVESRQTSKTRPVDGLF